MHFSQKREAPGVHRKGTQASTACWRFPRSHRLQALIENQDSQGGAQRLNCVSWIRQQGVKCLVNCAVSPYILQFYILELKLTADGKYPRKRASIWAECAEIFLVSVP